MYKLTKIFLILLTCVSPAAASDHLVEREPEVQVARVGILGLPKDVLLIVARELPKRWPLMNVCKEMQQINWQIKLKITFPYDFLSSRTWQSMLEGNKTFNWARNVELINLYQVCNSILCEDGNVEKELVSPALITSTLSKIFPNATTICLSFEDYSNKAWHEAGGQFALKQFYGKFVFASSLRPIFSKLYLNDRQASLFVQLYGNVVLDEYYGKGFSIDLARYSVPEKPLLYFPTDKKLLHILDTFEYLCRGYRYPDVPDIFRMLLNFLCDKEELIPVVLHLHSAVLGIDRLLKMAPLRCVPYEADSANVRAFMDVLTKLAHPDLPEIIDLLVTQAYELLDLPKAVNLSPEDILLPYLELLAKKPVEGRLNLVKRWFSFLTPEIHLACLSRSYDHPVVSELSHALDERLSGFLELNELSEHEFNRFLTLSEASKKTLLLFPSYWMPIMRERLNLPSSPQ